MKPPAALRPARWAVAACFSVIIASLSMPPARAGGEPLSIPVLVQVIEEGMVAAERSLRLLETAIVDELRGSGCVREAAVHQGSGDTHPHLVLRVVVKEVLEEARWNMHTGERAEAVQRGVGAPPVPDAAVRVAGEVQIVLIPESLRLRTKKFSVATGGSAPTPGTNPADAVRDEAIQRVALEARKTLCGSRAKLMKQIERARETVPSGER